MNQFPGRRPMMPGYSIWAVIGQWHTFGAIAGRCSAAHAATLKRLREERCYLRVSANWRAFCNEYLKMSQTQADQIIQLWD